MLLAGALRAPEPELDPVQLPYVPGDDWLALEFPDGHAVDGRPPALHRALRAARSRRRRASAALLLDEWTEVIPATRP